MTGISEKKQKQTLIKKNSPKNIYSKLMVENKPTQKGK